MNYDLSKHLNIVHTGNRCTRWRALTILAIVLVCPAANSEDTLSTIVEAYQRQDDRIASLSVEYETRSIALGNARDIVRYINTGYLANTEESFSYKKDMRHYTLNHANDGIYEHLVDREPDGSPSTVRVTPGLENASNGELVFTLDGKKQWRRHPAGIVGKSAEQGVSDASQFNQSYLSKQLRARPDVFGVDELRYRHSLLELASRSLLEAKSGLETIDGADCVRIDWADEFKHTIWCDPQLAYAVRRYESRITDADQYLYRTVTLHDFTEVETDVWYPKRIITDDYVPPEKVTKESPRTPLIRTELVVSAIEVNNVADDLFTPAIPPGTIIADTRFMKNGRAINYVQPASAEELEGVIAEVLASTSNELVIPKSTRSGAVYGVVVVNVLLLIAGIAFVIWRRRSLSSP